MGLRPYSAALRMESHSPHVTIFLEPLMLGSSKPGRGSICSHADDHVSKFVCDLISSQKPIANLWIEGGRTGGSTNPIQVMEAL